MSITIHSFIHLTISDRSSHNTIQRAKAWSIALFWLLFSFLLTTSCPQYVLRITWLPPGTRRKSYCLRSLNGQSLGFFFSHKMSQSAWGHLVKQIWEKVVLGHVSPILHGWTWENVSEVWSKSVLHNLNPSLAEGAHPGTFSNHVHPLLPLSNPMNTQSSLCHERWLIKT